MEEDLYEILGVSPEATKSEIKKRFQVLARKMHPDKNPEDPEAKEKFQKLSHAYDILKDDKKRERYDKFGIEEDAPPPPIDPMTEMFAKIFGQNFDNIFKDFPPPSRGNSYRRQKNVNMKMPMNNFFFGLKRQIAIPIKKICDFCKGSGSENGDISMCDDCKGRGQQIKVQMIGPGIMRQSQSVCDTCRGQGEVIFRKCHQCHGEKVIQKQALLNLDIPVGILPKQKIMFQGQGDHYPNEEPGDIVVTVEEENDTQFRRDGYDLVLDKEISVIEALIGVQLMVTNLDGQALYLVCHEVIKDGSIKIVEGKGFPNRDKKRGNLKIRFKVRFPDKIEDEQKDKLREIFNLPKQNFVAMTPIVMENE